jgi:hypothetical protein
MKTRLGCALLFLVTLGTGLGQGQQSNKEPDNGFWWVNQSETFKLGFVKGYASAMSNAADDIGFRCIAAKNGGVIPEKVPTDAVLTECMGSPTVEHFSFGDIRFGQLEEGMDDFYKDFRNKGVYVTAAMFYVRDELKGKSAKELEDELNVYRHGVAAKN